MVCVSTKVAKTLFNDESLKACPRCQHPARCHSVKREGVCSTADCGFQFCTACLCAFHGSKDCESLSAHRRMKKDVLPGSAQSKRNLRRLWMYEIFDVAVIVAGKLPTGVFFRTFFVFETLWGCFVIFNYESVMPLPVDFQSDMKCVIELAPLCTNGCT